MTSRTRHALEQPRRRLGCADKDDAHRLDLQPGLGGARGRSPPVLASSIARIASLRASREIR